jgi:hypothetical protein
MSDPTDLLEKVLACAASYVSAAAAAETVASVMTIVRIFPDPLRVEVWRRQRDNRTHVYEAPGTPDLAELLPAFLNDGLAAQPESLRRKTMAVLSIGQGELMAIINVDAETVSGVLRPIGNMEGADLVPLFKLRQEDTRH